MPSCDWLHNLAVRGCLITALLAVGSAVQAEEDNPVGHGPTYQAEAQEAPSDGDAAAPFWQDKDGRPQHYRNICEKPRNKDHAALCQQWRVAEAAERQAEIAYWQAVASALGIIGLVASIVVSAWASIAAGRAAKAAEKSVDVASETASRQLRAYLSIAEATIRFPDGNAKSNFPPNISIKFKNFGQTPANDVTTCWEMRGIRVGSKPDFSITDRMKKVIGTVAPSQDFNSTVIPTPMQWVMNRDAINTRKVELFIFGYVTYSDTFNVQHRNDFRMKLLVDDDGLGDDSFVLCEEGNQST